MLFRILSIFALLTLASCNDALFFNDGEQTDANETSRILQSDISRDFSVTLTQYSGGIYYASFKVGSYMQPVKLITVFNYDQSMIF